MTVQAAARTSCVPLPLCRPERQCPPEQRWAFSLGLGLAARVQPGPLPVVDYLAKTGVEHELDYILEVYWAPNRGDR